MISVLFCQFVDSLTVLYKSIIIISSIIVGRARIVITLVDIFMSI